MKEVLDNNRNISYIIHGILIPIVGAIGFGGNVVGIGYLVFRDNRKRNHTFYLLLLTLFLFDLTFIVSVTIMFSMREMFPHLYDEPVSAATLYLDYWSFPMSYLTLFGSIYFTVAICFERYMAICLPLFYRTKRRHSFLYMFMIFSFIVIVNIPHFLEINMKEDDNGEMNLYPSSLRNNRMYYYVYGVGVKFLFQYILPYTTLIVLNIKIWKVLRLQKISDVSMPSEQATFQITMSSNVTNQRKIQSELAKLSLILVVLLMVCTPVGLVNDIYEVIHGIEEKPMEKKEEWIWASRCFHHLILVVNSSTNSYIFLFKQYLLRSQNRRNSGSERTYMHTTSHRLSGSRYHSKHLK